MSRSREPEDATAAAAVAALDAQIESISAASGVVGFGAKRRRTTGLSAADKAARIAALTAAAESLDQFSQGLTDADQMGTVDDRVEALKEEINGLQRGKEMPSIGGDAVAEGTEYHTQVAALMKSEQDKIAAMAVAEQARVEALAQEEEAADEVLGAVDDAVEVGEGALREAREELEAAQAAAMPAAVEVSAKEQEIELRRAHLGSIQEQVQLMEQQGAEARAETERVTAQLQARLQALGGEGATVEEAIADVQKQTVAAREVASRADEAREAAARKLAAVNSLASRQQLLAARVADAKEEEARVLEEAANGEAAGAEANRKRLEDAVAAAIVQLQTLDAELIDKRAELQVTDVDRKNAANVVKRQQARLARLTDATNKVQEEIAATQRAINGDEMEEDEQEEGPSDADLALAAAELDKARAALETARVQQREKEAAKSAGNADAKRRFKRRADLEERLAKAVSAKEAVLDRDAAETGEEGPSDDELRALRQAAEDADREAEQARLEQKGRVSAGKLTRDEAARAFKRKVALESSVAKAQFELASATADLEATPVVEDAETAVAEAASEQLAEDLRKVSEQLLEVRVEFSNRKQQNTLASRKLQLALNEKGRLERDIARREADVRQIQTQLNAEVPVPFDEASVAARLAEKREYATAASDQVAEGRLALLARAGMDAQLQDRLKRLIKDHLDADKEIVKHEAEVAAIRRKLARTADLSDWAARLEATLGTLNARVAEQAEAVGTLRAEAGNSALEADRQSGEVKELLGRVRKANRERIKVNGVEQDLRQKIRVGVYQGTSVAVATREAEEAEKAQAEAVSAVAAARAALERVTQESDDSSSAIKSLNKRRKTASAALEKARGELAGLDNQAAMDATGPSAERVAELEAETVKLEERAAEKHKELANAIANADNLSDQVKAAKLRVNGLRERKLAAVKRAEMDDAKLPSLSVRAEAFHAQMIGFGAMDPGMSVALAGSSATTPAEEARRRFEAETARVTISSQAAVIEQLTARLDASNEEEKMHITQEFEAQVAARAIAAAIDRTGADLGVLEPSVQNFGNTVGELEKRAGAMLGAIRTAVEIERKEGGALADMRVLVVDMRERAGLDDDTPIEDGSRATRAYSKNLFGLGMEALSSLVSTRQAQQNADERTLELVDRVAALNDRIAFGGDFPMPDAEDMARRTPLAKLDVYLNTMAQRAASLSATAVTNQTYHQRAVADLERSDKERVSALASLDAATAENVEAQAKAARFSADAASLANRIAVMQRSLDAAEERRMTADVHGSALVSKTLDDLRELSATLADVQGERDEAIASAAAARQALSASALAVQTSRDRAVESARELARLRGVARSNVDLEQRLRAATDEASYDVAMADAAREVAKLGSVQWTYRRGARGVAPRGGLRPAHVAPETRVDVKRSVILSRQTKGLVKLPAGFISSLRDQLYTVALQISQQAGTTILLLVPKTPGPTSKAIPYGPYATHATRYAEMYKQTLLEFRRSGDAQAASLMGRTVHETTDEALGLTTTITLGDAYFGRRRVATRYDSLAEAVVTRRTFTQLSMPVIPSLDNMAFFVVGPSLAAGASRADTDDAVFAAVLAVLQALGEVARLHATEGAVLSWRAYLYIAATVPDYLLVRTAGLSGRPILDVLVLLGRTLEASQHNRDGKLHARIAQMGKRLGRLGVTRQVLFGGATADPVAVQCYHDAALHMEPSERLSAAIFPLPAVAEAEVGEVAVRRLVQSAGAEVTRIVSMVSVDRGEFTDPEVVRATVLELIGDEDPVCDYPGSALSVSATGTPSVAVPSHDGQANAAVKDLLTQTVVV